VKKEVPNHEGISRGRGNFETLQKSPVRELLNWGGEHHNPEGRRSEPKRGISRKINIKCWRSFSYWVKLSREA